MNIVTIHYLGDFHTRILLKFNFALVYGTIIVSSILSVNYWPEEVEENTRPRVFGQMKMDFY
jgi:hypothetical protein